MQYEYVYGDFQALYEKLRNGEIDMLLHVFKLDSNPDNLIYSDYAIGTESIFLFVKPENTSVIQNNLKTIDGKTVAVANNFYGFTFFKSWLARNNLSCSVVTFDTEKDAINAFERGDTDMLLYSDTHSNLDWIPLSRIAAFDYYIALAPGSNELYEELSRAQNKMYQMNPNFNYMIYNYMYSSLYYDWRLSEDETAWLENHPVVAIGCLKNNLPISDFDNSKKPCGFIADYMDVVKKELRLPSFTIYYKYYNDEESLIQALKNGEIDVAFPVSTDIYQAETSTIFISTPILRYMFSDSSDGSSPENAEKQLYLVNEKSSSQGNPFRNFVSFATTKQNTPFLDMMNRVKNFIPDETIHFMLNKYMPKEMIFSLEDFIVENFWYIIIFIILIIVALIGFKYGHSEKRKKNVVREELEKQKELRYQQEVLFNELIEDFDTIAIIDLDKEIVKQFSFRRYFKPFEKNMGKLSNYYDRMDYFADNAVFKDDIKHYKQAMKKEKILDALKDNPSYVVNFRTCIKNEIMYYQAKIVRDTSSKDSDTVILGIRNVDAETKLILKHRRLLEEAKVKAEVANKAKSTFLFNMSHDIRTPMNAIVGFTDMALESIYNPAKVKDYLEKVKLSSDHLLKLIDDILDMARIENGKIELEETNADLIKVIKNIISMIEGNAEQKNIRLSLSMENITDSRICIDVLRFNRVMMNVLTNAIKYTNSGGYVQFTVRQLSSKKDGICQYEFIIADNGIGMSKEFVRRIYDSFSRERSSTISGVSGTGLGMSITKGLVDKMGGKIKIKTQQRKGTSIFITLPIKVQNVEAANVDGADGSSAIGVLSAEKEMRTSFSGYRVLLVEDNQLNREIAKTILEQKSLEVEIAEDGVVALDKIRGVEDGYYDLVFMDIQMPFMNGYTATRMIRQIQNSSYASIPIIAMTANAFEEDRKKALEAGMNGHLTKPIKTDELLKVLNEFLN